MRAQTHCNDDQSIVFLHKSYASGWNEIKIARCPVFKSPDEVQLLRVYFKNGDKKLIHLYNGMQYHFEGDVHFIQFPFMSEMERGKSGGFNEELEDVEQVISLLKNIVDFQMQTVMELTEIKKVLISIECDV